MTCVSFPLPCANCSIVVPADKGADVPLVAGYNWVATADVPFRWSKHPATYKVVLHEISHFQKQSTNREHEPPTRGEMP